MLWSEISAISMLPTPQKFCTVFPPGLKLWPFNLSIVCLPFMTISLFFCFSFFPIRHVWNQCFLFVWGKWYRWAESHKHYFSLFYLANTIKCFLKAKTTIITVKCNIILCISGNWRRTLSETIILTWITPSLKWFLISFKFLSKLTAPWSREGRGTITSSNTKCLFVFRMSQSLSWKEVEPALWPHHSALIKRMSHSFKVHPLNLTRVFLLTCCRRTRGSESRPEWQNHGATRNQQKHIKLS